MLSQIRSHRVTSGYTGISWLDSQHITTRPITSCRIASCHEMSSPFTSFHVLSSPFTSRQFPSRHHISCPVKSLPVASLTFTSHHVELHDLVAHHQARDLLRRNPLKRLPLTRGEFWDLQIKLVLCGNGFKRVPIGELSDMWVYSPIFSPFLFPICKYIGELSKT